LLERPPTYQIKCEHNHSYKARAKAISPSGLSSPFSEESILLICDQKNPQIELDRLPSPAKLRYPAILITGTFDEPNLASLDINGIPAKINLINKRFSSRVNLNVGKNHLTLLAQDLAGNTTTKDIQLDYSPVNIVSLPLPARLNEELFNRDVNLRSKKVFLHESSCASWLHFGFV